MSDQRADVVVVGAGAAGVAAAWAAATGGANVVLVDEQDGPGGWLRTSLAVIHDGPEYIAGRRGYELEPVARESLESPSIDYRPSTVAWGLFENRRLGVVGPDGAYQLDADAVILATGSTEIVWPFAGWTLPGVMTARAARAVMHQHFVLPGRSVAVVGQGSDADQLCADLETAGSDVAVREPIADGVVVSGGDSVERISGSRGEHNVDAVLIAFGSLPDPELARHAHVALRFSARSGCHVPLRSAAMATSEDGIFVAGDAGGRTSVAGAVAEGFVAGFAASGSDRLEEAQASHDVASNDVAGTPAPGDPARIPDEEQVDREEQVIARRIRDAIGHRCGESERHQAPDQSRYGRIARARHRVRHRQDDQSTCRHTAR